MDYLHYLDVVKLRSPRTINGYYLDLRGFFRYMMMVWNLAQPDTPPPGTTSIAGRMAGTKLR